MKQLLPSKEMAATKTPKWDLKKKRRCALSIQRVVEPTTLAEVAVTESRGVVT